MSINLAMAVVVRQGTVLIQRRFRFARGMVYEFPGGKVDAFENHEASASRELREETGLVVSNPIHSEILTSESGGNIAFVVFRANDKQSPEEVDPIRQQEFFWYRLDEIPISEFHTADSLFIKESLSKWMF